MNDTAQETTAAMATLVEHEMLGASLLPVEEEKKHMQIVPLYICKLHSKLDNFITSICKHIRANQLCNHHDVY